MMTKLSSFEFNQDTADPERYRLLHQHIQEKIAKIQQYIKNDPSQASRLMDVLKGYISLKNVGIETRRRIEENMISKTG